MSFNPNATGSNQSGIFSLPEDPENSRLHILPIPWDVTTSFHRGTARGPQSILESSRQLDLCLPWIQDFYEHGIFFEKISGDTVKKNNHFAKSAQKIQDQLELGQPLNENLSILQKEINKGCEDLMNQTEEQSWNLLERGKIVGLVGGDHSCPLGLMKALKKKWGSYSVLHIDAHMDLRLAYQGFKFSHASIMRNLLESDSSCQLVQVGIRDYCPEERQFALDSPQVTTHFAADIFSELWEGKSWYQVCDRVIQNLGDKVYISFDIDGLDPTFCPNTGTPVPGGLSFHQMEGLLKKLLNSGKSIIGFDLCEVSPATNETMGIDGNVGARLLYMLCGLSLKTNP